MGSSTFLNEAAKAKVRAGRQFRAVQVEGLQPRHVRDLVVILSCTLEAMNAGEQAFRVFRPNGTMVLLGVLGTGLSAAGTDLFGGMVWIIAEQIVNGTYQVSGGEFILLVIFSMCGYLLVQGGLLLWNMRTIWLSSDGILLRGPLGLRPSWHPFSELSYQRRHFTTVFNDQHFHIPNPRGTLKADWLKGRILLWTDRGSRIILYGFGYDDFFELRSAIANGISSTRESSG